MAFKSVVSKTLGGIPLTSINITRVVDTVLTLSMSQNHVASSSSTITSRSPIKPTAVTGIIIDYAIVVIAEEEGYKSGLEAFTTFSNKLNSAIFDGTFISALQASSDPLLNKIDSTSATISKPVIKVVRTVAPTAAPYAPVSAKSVNFFNSLPLYAEILFSVGLFLGLMVCIVVVYLGWRMTYSGRRTETFK